MPASCAKRSSGRWSRASKRSRRKSSGRPARVCSYNRARPFLIAWIFYLNAAIDLALRKRPEKKPAKQEFAPAPEGAVATAAKAPTDCAVAAHVAGRSPIRCRIAGPSAGR